MFVCVMCLRQFELISPPQLASNGNFFSAPSLGLLVGFSEDSSTNMFSGAEEGEQNLFAYFTAGRAISMISRQIAHREEKCSLLSFRLCKSSHLCLLKASRRLRMKKELSRLWRDHENQKIPPSNYKGRRDESPSLERS